jgi:hypothetical protein
VFSHSVFPELAYQREEQLVARLRRPRLGATDARRRPRVPTACKEIAMWPAALIHVLSRAADGRAQEPTGRRTARPTVVPRRARRSLRGPS